MSDLSPDVTEESQLLGTMQLRHPNLDQWVLVALDKDGALIIRGCTDSDPIAHMLCHLGADHYIAPFRERPEEEI